MSNSISGYMVALCEYLADNSTLVWRENAEYASTETGLVLRDVILHPDRLVVVTPYMEDTSIGLPTRWISFQLLVRGGREVGDVDDIAEICYELLHDKHHMWWGDLEVARIRHISFVPLPPDNEGRWQRTDNYELLTQRRA